MEDDKNERTLHAGPSPANSVYGDFEFLYVRVYHMMDGRTVVPPMLYAHHEQAVEDLQWFGEEAGVRSLENVSYVTIERRFYPRRALAAPEA